MKNICSKIHHCFLQTGFLKNKTPNVFNNLLQNAVENYVLGLLYTYMWAEKLWVFNRPKSNLVSGKIVFRKNVKMPENIKITCQV